MMAPKVRASPAWLLLRFAVARRRSRGGRGGEGRAQEAAALCRAATGDAAAGVSRVLPALGVVAVRTRHDAYPNASSGQGQVMTPCGWRSKRGQRGQTFSFRPDDVSVTVLRF